MNQFRAGLLLSGFLFFVTVTQVLGQYTVSGLVMDDKAALSGVSVVLYEGKIEKKIPVNSTGDFYSVLKWNQNYFYKFSKKGYVSKIIQFSTEVPSGVNKSLLEPYNLQVRLFNVFEGVDTVFFKNPVAIIRYDKSVGDFAADRDYSLNIKYKIDKMMSASKTKKQNPTRANLTVGNSSKNKDAKLSKSSINKELKRGVPEVNSPATLLPPLKDSYPQGVNSEVFEFDGRSVTRTVINDGKTLRVLITVLHHWGGCYYFINQINSGYICVSKSTYDYILQTHR